MDRIRVLYSRDHATVYSGLGVFLAGPTPPESKMDNSWRREFINRLQSDQSLNSSMIVVAPEPEQKSWKSIIVNTGNPSRDKIANKQIPWELQYLSLCDITVFWFACYWDDESGGEFPGNIGPTSRLEFGYFLQEYLKEPGKKTFIVGAPEDAQSIEWVKEICKRHNLVWHTLPKKEKYKLIPDSLVNAVKEALLKN